MNAIELTMKLNNVENLDNRFYTAIKNVILHELCGKFSSIKNPFIRSMLECVPGYAPSKWERRVR